MINVKSLLKMTKSKKVKSLKNNELVYLTILLVLLSLTFNLNIKKEFKIILLIIAISICFYKPLLIGPFLIIIYIIYTQNKKRSYKNKKKIIEGFQNTKTQFQGFFNNPNTINNKGKALLFLNLIKNRDELKDYSKNIEFIEDLGNCFFFDLTKPEHLKKTILLSKKYDTVQKLYDTFEFTDITLDQGFNTYPERDQQEVLIDDELMKLGIFFYKNKFFSINRYLINSSNQLGFYSISNNIYKPNESEEDYESRNSSYSLLKKKINELIIIFYYFKYRVVEGEKAFYDYNKKIDLKNVINIFELINKDFLSNDDSKLEIMRNIINYISNFNLIEDKKIFISFSKEPEDLSRNNYTLEKLLDYHIDKLLDNIEEIKLINIKSYKITDRKERKTKVIEIFHNLFLLHLMSDSNLNSYLDEVDDSRNGSNKRLYNTLKNIFNKKSRIFKLQIKNEELMDDKYQFTSESDIFYDNLFFYFSKKYNDTSITKSYPQPSEIEEESESEGPAEEEKEEGEINPFFEQQQKNFELKLDDFLTDDQIKERQEEALEKYYKFLDKENIQKLEVLNNLADNKNLSEKHDKLKLDYIIENFGSETYKIIDEVILKFKSFLNEIKESDEDMGIFSNYQKYIQFLLDILSIMTKEERVLYSGFIFILLGLFIYFISEDRPRYIQQRAGFSRGNNLLDLLR